MAALIKCETIQTLLNMLAQEQQFDEEMMQAYADALSNHVNICPNCIDKVIIFNGKLLRVAARLVTIATN